MALIATTHPLGEKRLYTFVTTVSFYRGKLLLSRKRDGQTWETQGGHIEEGETPLVAARRELFEESGALAYTLHPVCDYSAAGTHGIAFFSVIKTLGPLPQSEMAEVRSFATLPPEGMLAYPGIAPAVYRQAVLWARARNILQKQTPR